MYKTLVSIIFFATIQFAKAQELTLSPAIKVSPKLNDFEILGKNSNGIFVKYFGANKNEIEVFSNNLRPMIRREIDLKDRNTRIESIFLREQGGVVFYSRNEQTTQYLEAKRFSGNLQLSHESIVLDSIVKKKSSGFEPYYVKQSPDRKYFATFSIYESQNNFSVRYSIFDSMLEFVDGGIFENAQENIVLKSFKISDQGVVYAVMARLSKKKEMQDYSADEIYTYLYDSQSKKGVQQVSDSSPYAFKNFVTEIDAKTGRAFVAVNYINTQNKEDLGLLVMSSDSHQRDEKTYKHSFTKEAMMGLHSFSVKNWVDQALIIRPRKIIPQSGGGCLVISESQYRTTRVVRDMPSMHAYPYMYGNSYSTRVFDQNNYFDISTVSIDYDGQVNWTAVMPKKQITEGDGGLYSSFLLFQSNTLLKFLFNEDIYSSGNFVEYNLNPAGFSKRVSVLNSEQGQFAPIPQRGMQISPNELLIPSEQKKNLKFILIKY